MIYYLIAVGVCLYLYGALRTLSVYIAIIAMVLSLMCAEAVMVGFSYLFWNESVRTFQSGEFWASMFTDRVNFTLWQAPAVPVIFFFDLVRMGFKFCWQVPNVFSIGVFAYWWYLMAILWVQIILPMFKSIPKSTSTALVRM